MCVASNVKCERERDDTRVASVPRTAPPSHIFIARLLLSTHCARPIVCVCVLLRFAARKWYTTFIAPLPVCAQYKQIELVTHSIRLCSVVQAIVHKIHCQLFIVVNCTQTQFQLPKQAWYKSRRRTYVALIDFIYIHYYYFMWILSAQQHNDHLSSYLSHLERRRKSTRLFCNRTLIYRCVRDRVFTYSFTTAIYILICAKK